MNKKYDLFSLISFLVSGIIVLDTFPQPAALGASALTLWLIVAIFFMIPNGFINAELGAAYPDGIVAWVKESMGEFHATITGWFYWLNVSLWMPAVFIVFTFWFSMTYFSDGEGWTTLGNVPMLAIALVANWILIIVVRRGIDVGVKLNRVATVAKIAVLLIFGLLGITHAIQNGVSEVFVDANWMPSLGGGNLGLVTAIVFNLLGFELVASIGDRVENPEKNIPRAIIIAAGLIGFFYIFGTYGILQAATHADLADELFIVDGFIISMEILTADLFGAAGPAIFKVIMGVTLFTLITNMISWVIGASEVLEDAEFSKLSPIFHERHPKYGTLAKSYTVMGIISSILIAVGFLAFDGAGDGFWAVLAFSMVIFIYPYIYLSPAILRLRKRDGVESRSFVVPGGDLGLKVMAALNFLFIALAIFLLFFLGGYDLNYYLLVVPGTLISTLIGIYFYKKGQTA